MIKHPSIEIKIKTSLELWKSISFGGKKKQFVELSRLFQLLIEKIFLKCLTY